MRGDNDRDGASSITSICSLNIPVAISHCLFYLKVMDDWQTQNKSVGCSTSSKPWYASCGNLWWTYDLRKFMFGISEFL